MMAGTKRKEAPAASETLERGDAKRQQEGRKKDVLEIARHAQEEKERDDARDWGAIYLEKSRKEWEW